MEKYKQNYDQLKAAFPITSIVAAFSYIFNIAAQHYCIRYLDLSLLSCSLPIPVRYLTCSLPTLSLPIHVRYLAFSLPVFFATLIFSSQR